MNILKRLFSSNNLQRYLLPLSTIIALTLRFYFLKFPSHAYDMATFHSWATNLRALGPAEFYASIWTDYLPLPLYLTALAKNISLALNLPFNLAFKGLFTLLELILIFLIHRTLPKASRKWIISLLLLSPASIINTTIWGQIDIIPSLLLALSLTQLLYNKKVTSSAIFLALAASIKPIVLITLPIYLITLHRRRQFIHFSLVSFSAFLIPAIPVVAKDIGNLLSLFSKPFFFLYNQASYQASMYPYTTVNAFNYWSLTGSSWQPDLVTILGVSKHVFGLFLFIALASFLFFKNYQDKSKEKALIIAGSLLVMFYLFATRMHERHLIYGLPLLALSAYKFKQFLLPYFIFNTTYFINMWSALYWVSHNQSWPIAKETMIIISWVNIIAGLIIFLSLSKLNFSKLKHALVKNKALVIIMITAFTLRLINLSSPKQMIFDEVYHGFTASRMLVGDSAAWEWWNMPPEGYAYEWTHPPLAKYGMVASMLIFGANSFGWRVGSAIIGALSIFVFYKLTNLWFKNSRTALIAAGLLSIEGIHLVQSRVAMNDIYVLFFILLSLYLASANKWKHSALALGFALSSKWSAVYALFPLVFIYLKHHKKLNIKLALNAVRLLLISLIVYVLLYTPFFLSGHTVAQFQELHWQMWNYHTNLTATHAYQSTPFQWILALRPVWYHIERVSGLVSNIYSHANPAIAWLGIAAVIDLLRKKDPQITLPLIAYFSFLIPWTISPRIMFNYHYLPSITFLTMILAYWISRLPRNYSRSTLYSIIIVFVILWPIYSGIKAPQKYWDIIFNIFPTWK